jgi:hypothetical protein
VDIQALNTDDLITTTGNADVIGYEASGGSADTEDSTFIEAVRFVYALVLKKKGLATPELVKRLAGLVFFSKETEEDAEE